MCSNGCLYIVTVFSRMYKEVQFRYARFGQAKCAGKVQDYEDYWHIAYTWLYFEEVFEHYRHAFSQHSIMDLSDQQDSLLVSTAMYVDHTRKLGKQAWEMPISFTVDLPPADLTHPCSSLASQTYRVTSIEFCGTERDTHCRVFLQLLNHCGLFLRAMKQFQNDRNCFQSCSYLSHSALHSSTCTVNPVYTFYVYILAGLDEGGESDLVQPGKFSLYYLRKSSM